jgi:hypothetical protein
MIIPTRLRSLIKKLCVLEMWLLTIFASNNCLIIILVSSYGCKSCDQSDVWRDWHGFLFPEKCVLVGLYNSQR